MKTKPSPNSTPAATRNGTSAAPRRAGAGSEFGPMMADLYARAVAQMRTQRKNQKSKAKLLKSETDPQRLLHELQVHQVELELQNDELWKTRDEMEAGRDKYSDLYDFAPIGYLTLDREGTIVEANLAGASLLGVDRAALMKRRFGAFVSPADRAAFAAFLQQVFETKAREECDVQLLLKSTELVDVRIRAIVSSTAQVCRMAVTDITEHKRAEAKVRVSEVRYRRLFEAAHDGVLILDPDTRKITDANPFMTSLLGYSHAQFVGKELFEIGLLKGEAASQEMFRKLKRNSEVFYEELLLESQDGRHREVEVLANLYQENGHAVIQCNIREITQRKQVEEVLRRNEALFSALIEQAPVGIYVVNARWCLHQVNPTAQPVFKNIRPLIGQDFSRILHALWPERVADQIAKRFRHTFKTGEPYQLTDFAERRRDTGVKEFYEWQIQRVTLPAGELGVVCFFSNITKRKQAEEAQRRVAVLAASNRKLEKEIVRRQVVEEALRKSEQHQSLLLEQSRVMQEQLRRLSRQILMAQEEERKAISRELHDVIAQTLTAINIRLAALKKGASLNTEDLDRNIVQTQRLVEKSVDIVHQFARELRPAVLDDLGLIPALHAYMESFTARTGIRASLRAAAKVEQLDPSRRTVLFRVAQEALTNVSRHAQASHVEVSLQKSRESICMRITDDGKSFDVHRTLNGEGRKRLGLLGMMERVEMIDGCFDVESAPGKGTTIVARIPLGKVARGGAGGVR